MWIMIFQLHMTSLLQVLRLVVCSQNITIHIGSDYIMREMNIFLSSASYFGITYLVVIL